MTTMVAMIGMAMGAKARVVKMREDILPMIDAKKQKSDAISWANLIDFQCSAIDVRKEENKKWEGA